MATTKPRITVTLSDRQYAAIKAISDNSGQSMSAFLGELLEQSLPVLERMGETFRKIKSAQDEHRARIASELDLAQSAVEPIVAQALGQFDLFCKRVESASGVEPGLTDAPRGALAVPAALLADPRPVITGVRSPVAIKDESPKTRTSSGSRAKRRTGVSP